MKSILYVSDSKIGFSFAKLQLSQLVEHARSWNASVGITGALVFTERHFVQFIEGPTAVVDDMLAKLRSDWRHTNMIVIEATDGRQRQFRRWSLAYCGPDDFIDQKLKALLHENGDAPNAAIAADLKATLFAMASYD